MQQCERLRLIGQVVGQIRRRCDDLDADAVPLHRLHHRPGRRLPEWRAGHVGGQLAGDRDLRLGQQRGAGGQRSSRGLGL